MRSGNVEIFHNSYDDIDEYTDQYQGSKRKIKSEIFFFYFKVTGQVTKKPEFITKKIPDDTSDSDKNSGQNGPFSDILIHVQSFSG